MFIVYAAFLYLFDSLYYIIFLNFEVRTRFVAGLAIVARLYSSRGRCLHWLLNLGAKQLKAS